MLRPLYTERVAADLFAISTGPGEGLVFAPDGSGWCSYSSPRYPKQSQVFLRFARAGDGAAFAVREIHFAFEAGLGTRSFRELPLGRLEAAVNQPEHHAELSKRVPPNGVVAVPFPENVYATDEDTWPWWMYKIPPKPRAPRLKVKIPDGGGRRKPDRFYEQIAERFAYLATVSPRPATDLAKANDVPVTTVHGWVKEARRRGLLATGERARKQL
jgi:hypothetical protein